MFRDNINAPIDPIPQEYIATINRLNNEPDYSLTCLGIALLKHRIEDYKGITGWYASYDKETSCVQHFLDNEPTGEIPAYCYYIYSQDAEDNYTKEKLAERGYEFKDSISLLLKDKASTKCVAAYHKEKNVAAVFVNSRNMQVYHLMISFMSVLYPCIFKDYPMTDKDYDVVKSLSKNEKNAFIQRIKDAVQPYAIDFKRIMLGTLLKSMHEQKICKAKDDVDNQRHQLDYLDQQMEQEINKLRNLIVIYEGMKATESYDKPEEELVEYLATNRSIHGMNVCEGRLTFCVSTLLNNFNENAWDTFAKAGHIFDGMYEATLLNVFKDRDNRVKILNSIFSEDAEFSVKMCSNYMLDLNTCRIMCQSRFNYEDIDPSFKDRLVNPHVGIFACLGGYKDRVRRELEKRNYIGAIELCIASAGSINLDETTQTFRPFLGWLLSSRNKVLRRKDGVEMTPEEALIYLIDKEKANETT